MSSLIHLSCAPKILVQLGSGNMWTTPICFSRNLKILFWFTLTEVSSNFLGKKLQLSGPKLRAKKENEIPKNKRKSPLTPPMHHKISEKLPGNFPCSYSPISRKSLWTWGEFLSKNFSSGEIKITRGMWEREEVVMPIRVKDTLGRCPDCPPGDAS